MKKIPLAVFLRLALLVVGLVMLSSTSIIAAESKSAGVTRAKAVLKQVRHKQSQLARVLRKAGAATKAALVESSLRDSDADGDGASDDLEQGVGSDLCDTDTDDDGIQDDDEIGDDTDPEDPTEGYYKAEAAVLAVAADSITVGDLTCAIDSATKIEVNEQSANISAILVGDLVELKCSLAHVALKIESGSDSDDEENDDHGSKNDSDD